jgi:nitrogen-specific signal transduction histidine kinase
MHSLHEAQALLDAAVDAIVLIDHDGRIQAFNRAAERCVCSGYPILTSCHNSTPTRVCRAVLITGHTSTAMKEIAAGSQSAGRQ